MRLNPYAQPWTPRGLCAPAGIEAKAPANKATESTFELAELPAEVITSVVSFLTDPRDLISCICSCKLLKGHVHEAELVLDIRSWRAALGPVNNEGILASKPKAFLGLSKYMPGTVALLLPNLSLEDSDVDYLLGKLPRLQMLDVSGARKITHAAVSALARAASPGLQAQPARKPVDPAAGSTGGAPEAAEYTGRELLVAAPRQPVPLPLRFANLQRCFQLHGGSLDELLTLPGLRCLALSHLDLGRWPAPSGAMDARPPQVASPLPRNGLLQVLALNNCLRLHGAAIDALAAACGGNTRFLLLGGSTLALSSFVSNGASAAPPEHLPPRLAGLLEAAYRPALTSSATTTAAHLAAARHLLAAVLAMPALVALDLTFFPQPLVQCLRCVLADADALGRGRVPVEVWDFAAAGAADVEAARRALRSVLRARSAPAQAVAGLDAAVGGGRAGDALDELAVATVLRCAVNCSSVTRSTPLHVAAERGAVSGVGQLLAAGAVVDARDTAGSTPLFLASEAGHTAVVERLLAAGADPSLGNVSGETPLYIAALRGHLGCVKALLGCCKARGIAWQDPEMYGDAWTPLHAAAVANRADVAAYLLQAAGASGAGELVLAPNKYGQSVLHVAARKGSAQLLRLLLSAGGAAVVGSRDGSGDTPVDVAKKNRHVEALAEFRRLTTVHGTAPRTSQAAATAMA
ncbi:hypothetical protein PLESTB_001609200 [Pleodorina starrii]|uniref:Uncharacterized protein n=1 Tax=Pleodorina starrii TaxID=330485 RepID=A0A9W6BY89_9CHLO|nr:hypothetical protein PLESTB_001609200 [Pleodorina starrii]GLC64137.1 hypothetical protein PLESTF_000128500 [Pleodorina starrii]